MNANNELTRLRRELDIVDDQLLDLIERRLSLCTVVGAAKASDVGLPLRPSRQRRIIERLQLRAQLTPPEAIRHIWRELMAHGVHLQAPVSFAVVRGVRADLTARLVRERYGSAAPIEWEDNLEAAMNRALTQSVVAVVAHSSDRAPPPELTIFDELCDENGTPVAQALGRISENEDASPQQAPVRQCWAPGTWRARPHVQLPAYRDTAALGEVERQLACRAPVVELNDVDCLNQRMDEVAAGGAILLQAGDCSETFEGSSRQSVAAVANLIADMATIIEEGAARKVVRVGRIAGQLAKPRSHLVEIVDGVEMPTYRGDAINSPKPDLSERTPDPARLLETHQHSERVARWLAGNVPDGREPLYVSHEALLLQYEQALTHRDELTARWWAGSGHFLWVGDRTRGSDGAHVEFLRGIANPLAVKCGPSLDPDELLRLLDKLNTERRPGRVTLIARLGYRDIDTKLPSLLRATRREGWQVPWCIDPMHGNTQKIGTIKSRHLAHVRAEIDSFFGICSAEDVWPGGVHLELTPDEVTECIDDMRVRSSDLARRYTSACDPRLNVYQALDLAHAIADQYRSLRRSVSRQ